MDLNVRSKFSCLNPYDTAPQPNNSSVKNKENKNTPSLTSQEVKPETAQESKTETVYMKVNQQYATYCEKLKPIIDNWLKGNPISSGQKITFTLEPVKTHPIENSSNSVAVKEKVNVKDSSRALTMTLQQDGETYPKIPDSVYDLIDNIQAWMKDNPIRGDKGIQIDLRYQSEPYFKGWG